MEKIGWGLRLLEEGVHRVLGEEGLVSRSFSKHLEAGEPRSVVRAARRLLWLMVCEQPVCVSCRQGCKVAEERGRGFESVCSNNALLCI